MRSAKAKKAKLTPNGNGMTEPTSIMMRDNKGRRRKIAKRPDVSQRAPGKQSTGKTEAESTQTKIDREQASKAATARWGKKGK